MTETAPPPPYGWEDCLSELIRIQDAAGTAVAWVAPRFGANAVGFAVKDGSEWLHILHSEGPTRLVELPSRFGFPILFPHVGQVRDGRYAWHGQQYQLPPSFPGFPNFMHGFGHTRAWRATRVAPNRMRATLSTAVDLQPAERAGYPFDVEAELDIELVDGALRATLVATNVGSTDAPVNIGFHPYFDPAVFGVDRTDVRVAVPGPLERAVGGGDGQTRPAPSEPIVPGPLGDRWLWARAGLKDGDIATLSSPSSRRRVVLEMGGAVQDLLVFCPDTSPSISIEPLAAVPGGFSRPEGDPSGPISVPPGGKRRLTTTVRLQVSG
ncbi:MAG: aldose 1-epimerase [Chloroflexota bacterium]